MMTLGLLTTRAVARMVIVISKPVTSLGAHLTAYQCWAASRQVVLIILHATMTDEHQYALLTSLF